MGQKWKFEALRTSVCSGTNDGQLSWYEWWYTQWSSLQWDTAQWWHLCSSPVLPTSDDVSSQLQPTDGSTVQFTRLQGCGTGYEWAWLLWSGATSVQTPASCSDSQHCQRYGGEQILCDKGDCFCVLCSTS